MGIRKKSPEQQRIDASLVERKKYLLREEPWCIFGGESLRRGQLCHIIRRSWASRFLSRFSLQTSIKNTGLGCQYHHDIWDSGTPEDRKALPNYDMLMKRVGELDPEYYKIRLFYDN